MRRHLVRSTRRGFLAVLLALSLGALSSPSSAPASPPANDNFADAQPITSLPFTDSGDLNGTTTEPGEPGACNGMPQTVWYSLSVPSTESVRVDVSGSDGGVAFNVWQSSGGGIGGLSFVGCGAGFQPVQFSARAGITYYIQAGSVFFGSVQMQLHVQAIPPPANDNFAQAKTVSNLPFSDLVDLSSATVEPGEPTLPTSAFGPIAASAWYSFTAPVSETLLTAVDSCCTQPILAVYTGSSLASLTQVAGVSGFSTPMTFKADAGTTYYFQLGRVSTSNPNTPMQFRLQVAPLPSAQFFFFPGDASVFDNVQFFDQSYDPAGIGIQTQAWDFGDGKNGSGCCPLHRYAVDGDYTIMETVTTTDGRSASTSQMIHVRTHDVTLTTLSAPTSGKVGKAVQLVAKLGNTRYPETVEIDLLKSTPNGFSQVSSTTQGVPVMRRNQTVDFKFTYIFTADDAAQGKVTFKAVARIISFRDALPGDNEAVAQPTKVTP
jgi:hypothetical protein